MATSVDKALWSHDGQTVFAAAAQAPGASGAAAGDAIYKISAASGTQSQVSAGDTIDARDLFLSQDGTVLFFRNAADGLLHYVNLSSAQ